MIYLLYDNSMHMEINERIYEKNERISPQIDGGS